MKIRPLKIGVTGGIGSGKTTVCRIFESLDIPVYYADDRAKTLMANDPILMEQIIDNFGPSSYFSDGGLNRGFIAGIVFQQPEKLIILNQIVHPAVRTDGLKWHKEQKRVPYTIKEAALMIESGNYKGMDKIIVVTAPIEARIQRVMKRDKVDEAAVNARINKQMPEKEKLKYADFIITNDGNHSLIKQVIKIHQSLVGTIE